MPSRVTVCLLFVPSRLHPKTLASSRIFEESRGDGRGRPLVCLGPLRGQSQHLVSVRSSGDMSVDFVCSPPPCVVYLLRVSLVSAHSDHFWIVTSAAQPAGRWTRSSRRGQGWRQRSTPRFARTRLVGRAGMGLVRSAWAACAGAEEKKKAPPAGAAAMMTRRVAASMAAGRVTM